MATEDDLWATIREELTLEDIKALKEVAEDRRDNSVSRRAALGAIGAGSLAAASGIVGNATAQPDGSPGQIGTQSTRIDAWLDEADGNALTVSNEFGLPEYDDVSNAPQTQGRVVYATGAGVSSEGVHKHDGSSYSLVGGESSEWQEDGSGNIVPIDGETVGDGTTTANHNLITAENTETTTVQNGRVYINAADPAGILTGSTIAAKIDDALTYLDNNFFIRGTVVVPMSSDGGAYDCGSDRITIPRPDNRDDRVPSIVGVGPGAQPKLKWTGSLSGPAIELPPTDGDEAEFGSIQGLELRTSTTASLPSFIDLDDVRNALIRDVDLSYAGEVSDAAIRVKSSGGSGSPWGIIERCRIRGQPQTGVRLGVDGGNSVNAWEIRNSLINADSGSGTAIQLYGNDNTLSSSLDVTTADVGVVDTGIRNEIKNRLESIGTTYIDVSNATDARVEPRNDGILPTCNLNGTRIRVYGWGENAGDPNTTGQWNGNGEEGVAVVDTTNNVKYVYRGGSWV